MFTCLPKQLFRFISLSISLLCWFGGSIALMGQSLPAGFSNIKAQDGYSQPMGILFSANGQQQFVWDKAGRIWASTWNGTQYVKQATPALNISPEVGNWRDFGLLSVALDPNFSTTGYVYLFYVVDRHHLMTSGTASYSATVDNYYDATISRVTRYTMANTNGTFSTDPTTRRVLLGESKSTGVPLLHQSHAGGTLLFGRDGTLLLTTGDNASYSSTDKGSAPETYYQNAINDGILRANENVGAFRSQMLTSLCGKVLRMDPNTGDGVSSNPFYDAANPRSAKSRVWALGLRNPYRMGIQPGTGSTNPADANPGTLFVGDVGWDAWEDTHIIRLPGENAGWPIFEGQGAHPNYSTAAQTLENKDEPNPANTCSKPFLTFADLLKQATNPQAVITNPCNSTLALPGLQRRYVHSRPALAWQHGVDVTQTPTFSGTLATATTISPSSTVCTGTPFRGNCATAGAYYPANTTYPAEWRNTYFFADYGANWIKAATVTATGSVTAVRDFLPAGQGNGVVDLEYNPLDGAVYFVSIANGEIRRLSYGGNRPPVAVASASSLTGTSPLSVTFTGSNSSDPDGDPLTYLWNFGDGTTSAQANPTKVFSATAGRGYSVQLTVSDGRGLTDNKTLQVSLNNAAPTARISNPLDNAKYVLDRESSYTLTANITDDTPNSLTYAWQVTLRHNNHEHREPVVNAVAPVVTISPVGCDGENYYYLINLKVTDAGGLFVEDSVKIYPDCNSAKLAISALTATTATNSVRLNWTNPTVSFDNVLVVGKAGSGFIDKPNQPSYTANSSFSATNTAFFGGKVLYQGIANTVTVTELAAGQPYFFRVYTRRGSAWTGGVEISATPASTTPPPASVTAVEPGKCYRILSRVSGRVLGVENGSKDDGGAIRQRTDANQDWQRWKFEQIVPGFYQLIAAHSDKVIDVWWSSQDNGAGLHQWSSNGIYSQNQHWALQRNAEGYFQITARHSGKALDVQNSNQTEGGMIIQFTPNGGAQQQWMIEERSCTTGGGSVTVIQPPTNPVAFIDPAKCYRIQSRSSGKVLNVPSGLPDDGVQIRQNTNTEKNWQKWKFYPVDGGYYRISVMHNGKSIQVPDFSTQNSVLLHQWTYWGGGHQQWSATKNAENFYTFTNRNSGKVIDVSNSNTNEGGDIIQFEPNGGNNQQWSLTETSCPVGARLSAMAGRSDEPGMVFSLSPNPARDHVLVDLSPAQGMPVGLGLSDLTGRSLHQVRIEKATDEPYRLDIGHLTDGLYLISVTPDGHVPSTLRLLIQR